MKRRHVVHCNDRASADVVYRWSLAAFVYAAYREMNGGASLVANWHIDAFCYYLEEMFDGHRPRRLVVNLPPRALKSFIVSICLTAWLLGRNPASRILCASYNDDLSKKFSRDTRALMETAFYRRLFPHTRLNPRKTSEGEFETTKHGYRLATSVGGTLTGRGGDVLIVDDPIKANDAYSEVVRANARDWFTGTALSRLDDQRHSKIIVVMQRVHADDLSGFLLEKGWPGLVFPSIAVEGRQIATGYHKSYWRQKGEVLQPRRESIDYLNQLKSDQGSHIFEAQFQQNPVPPDGNLVKSDWLKRFSIAKRPEFQHVLIGCDPAAKTGMRNDFTAIVAVGVNDRHLYVLEASRGRWGIVETLEHLKDVCARWPHSAVTVEATASGPGIIEMLQEVNSIDVRGVTPRDSKETRLMRQLAKFECGRISCPDDAPWLPEFLHELLAFPNGRYDDQVDALLLVLEWYDERFAYEAGCSGAMPWINPREDDFYDRFSNRG